MRRPIEERKCHVCGERTLKRVVQAYERPMTHDGRSVTIHIPDLSVVKCCNPQCRPDDPADTTIIDDAATRRIDEETYRQLGLLLPAEIRAGRERLGLTQQQLQDLLRLGGNSLSRWESGAVYQSRSLDTLLRIAFGIPGVVDFLSVESTESFTNSSSNRPKFRYLEPEPAGQAAAVKARIRCANIALCQFGLIPDAAHV